MNTLTGKYTQLISLVHQGVCQEKSCKVKSRMALVVPVSDIGEDGGPGLAAIRLCGTHLEGALLNLKKAEANER